ncbi:unnamed protein product [Oikopleura dioica]|uniref:Uncharacterized protein n=1 Tax=Oikopleura dioica TaxID=34765 RepID=E4WPV1_OIKDI|nr:unnamed protein product [Oikopleura dioica]CBY39465.1 unnamed protein product [Oikopleura dioica]
MDLKDNFVVQDIAEAYGQGIKQVLDMAYDAGINEIWDTMDQMDQNIRSQSERGLITDQRELTELTMKMNHLNNPMQYMTPILITVMVVIAILCTMCMCAFGFCWYVRFNKKQKRPYVIDDLERNRRNDCRVKNFTEENIQFVNNQYYPPRGRKADSTERKRSRSRASSRKSTGSRIWRQARKSFRTLRKDKFWNHVPKLYPNLSQFDKSSEAGMGPMAGGNYSSQEDLTPIHTPTRKYHSGEESSKTRRGKGHSNWDGETKQEKSGW